MSLNAILQIALFIQVFVLGVIVTLAVQYYRRHYGATLHETEFIGQIKVEELLSPTVKQRLVEESEIKIQAALNATSERLKNDLGASSYEISQLVKKLASDIVSGEMERYRLQMGQLHEQANQQMGAIRAEVAKHQETIQAKVVQELELEKQRLIRQIDTKLADAVGSFLNETLQHNIDIGGQTQYLMAMLEEHKADFIREVGTDEPKPAN